MTLDNETNRFDRFGWDQKTSNKVKDSIVTIISDADFPDLKYTSSEVGSSPSQSEGFLAKYISSYLTSAGFGNFRFVGNSKRQDSETHLWNIPLDLETQVASYAKGLPKLWPEVKTQIINSALNNSFVQSQLKNSTVLVDATNNPSSKTWALSTGIQYNIPVVSTSLSGENANLMVYNPNTDNKRFRDLDERLAFMMKDFHGKPQSELASMAWAGPVSEEIKKIVLGEKGTLDCNLEYEFPVQVSPEKYKGMKVLVAGVGAAGNKVIPALAMMGFSQVDFVDFDNIEITNYPRTEFLVGHEGEKKVKVMEDEIRKVFPNTIFNGYDKIFDRKFDNGVEYDLVIDVVDRDFYRNEVYIWAMDREIAHVSIGTSFSGFNTVLASPYETACYHHYYPGFDELVKSDLAMESNGCIRTEPSNSWMQAGSIFEILQIPTVFFPEESGEPDSRILYYSATMKDRFTKINADPCFCWGNKDVYRK